MDCWPSIVITCSLGALILGAAACGRIAGDRTQDEDAVANLPPIPDFTLTDQTGAQFSSAQQLHGVDWIADFVYTTCPGPCPRMSAQMHEVEKELDGIDGVRLVSFTVDPAHDTPPVLAAYAQRFGAKPGIWFFLTGSPDTLQHLSRDAFMLGNVDGTLEHSTRFVLVDKKSHIRGYYLTSESDAISRLVKDTKAIARSGD